MPSTDVVTVATDAGSLALWNSSAFTDVCDHDTWEARVNDRLTDAIEAGELVPIGIQSDGAFGVRVAVVPDRATDREARHTIITSDPYLLVAHGDPIVLSGIESVGDGSDETSIELPAGRYTVRVSIVAWDEEPGARGPDGLPVPGALPDFIVAVEPSNGSEVFRKSDATFDPPR